MRNALGAEGSPARWWWPPPATSRRSCGPAALYATALAEHFRAGKARVLLVMDSVTRYAMALREATLAAGEPPLTRATRRRCSRRCRRCSSGRGRARGGLITAVYTVLVEGDDLNDPIADAVRGILDGHIVLSRRMADRGLFPPSTCCAALFAPRAGPLRPRHLDDAAKVRGLLAAYEDAADLIQIGAYVAGSDPRRPRPRRFPAHRGPGAPAPRRGRPPRRRAGGAARDRGARPLSADRTKRAERVVDLRRRAVEQAQTLAAGPRAGWRGRRPRPSPLVGRAPRPPRQRVERRPRRGERIGSGRCASRADRAAVKSA